MDGCLHLPLNESTLVVFVWQGTKTSFGRRGVDWMLMKRIICNIDLLNARISFNMIRLACNEAEIPCRFTRRGRGSCFPRSRSSFPKTDLYRSLSDGSKTSQILPNQNNSENNNQNNKQDRLVSPSLSDGSKTSQSWLQSQDLAAEYYIIPFFYVLITDGIAVWQTDLRVVFILPYYRRFTCTT